MTSYQARAEEYPDLLSWPDVTSITGLRKQQIQEMVRRQQFPLPLCLSERIRRFDRDEVLGWMDDRYSSRERACA